MTPTDLLFAEALSKLPAKKQEVKNMSNSKTLKLVIAGGRDFQDMELLKATLNEKYQGFVIEVVCGMARGADMLGATWAKQVGAVIHEFPADWDRHGKSAGYRRNEDMARFGDAVLAFWDGKSKGTAHMIDLANKHKKSLTVVMYNQ